MGFFSGIGSGGLLSDKDVKRAQDKGDRMARKAAESKRAAARYDRKAANLDAKAAKKGWW